MADTARVHLRVLSGPNEGAELALDEDRIVLGADAARCSVVLLDPEVHDVHVTIWLDDSNTLRIVPEPDARVAVDGESIDGAGVSTGRTACLSLGTTELLLRLIPATQVSEVGPVLEQAVDSAVEPEATSAARVGGWLRSRRSRSPFAGRATTGLGILVIGVTGAWSYVGAGLDGVRAGIRAPDFDKVPVRAEGPVIAGITGPVTHDAALRRQPATAVHSSRGTVLFETLPAAVATAPAPAPVHAQGLQHRLRRIADGPDGPTLETLDGSKFPLSSRLRSAYAMRWIGESRIELHRGEERITIEVD